MEYFHGSMKERLTKLKPNTSLFSNLKEPLVYLTAQLTGQFLHNKELPNPIYHSHV